LRAMRRGVELMARGVPQKEVEAVKVMASEGIPVQLALRVLDVACRATTTGGRARRRHARSGTPGSLIASSRCTSAPAEPMKGTPMRLGGGIVIGHGAVARCCAGLGSRGAPASPSGARPNPARSLTDHMPTDPGSRAAEVHASVHAKRLVIATWSEGRPR
jgi:hypothetical protein